MIDLSRARWRKSRRSSAGDNCVEVAGNLPDVVAVQDSKNPGPALVFNRDVWTDFAASVKTGRHDL